MSIDGLWPAALRDANIVIGVVLLAAGILVRRKGGDGRGLGWAFAIVGLMLIIAGPLGRIAGWW